MKTSCSAVSAAQLRPSSVIVCLRIGNATNPQLLNWLMPLWPAVLKRLDAGDRLIEVR